MIANIFIKIQDLVKVSFVLYREMLLHSYDRLRFNRDRNTTDTFPSV